MTDKQRNWNPFAHIQRSISYKLSLALLLIITAAFSITGYLIYSHAKQLMTNEIESGLDTKSGAIADEVGALFREKGTLVREMATNQDILNFLKTAKSRDEVLKNPYYANTAASLDAILATDKTLSFAWLASNDGGFYIGDHSALSKPDYDAKNRPWYAEAAKAEDLSYTEPYIDAETGKLVVSILHPVKNDGKLIGFVAVDLFLDTLPGIMESYKFGQTGFTVLTAKDSTIMYHPDKELVMKKKLSEMEGDIGALSKKSGQNQKGLAQINTNGNQQYVGFAPVDVTGWTVFAFMSKTEALAGMNSFARTTFVYFALSIVLLVVAVYFMLRYMLRHIPLMSEILERISNGDLRHRVIVKSKDEIGQVASSINQMLDSISAIIDNVHLASEQLAAASEELNAATDQSVEMGNRIVDSIQSIVNAGESQLEGAKQTSTAMEEMTVGVTRVAESSGVVSESSASSLLELERGQTAVLEAVSQMQSIRISVGMTAQEMKLLNEYSQNINEITAVITDISNQTQLLSLNASIEAARAGEHGRGFAVVANEVKKLAEQSVSSADRIAKLIGDIKRSTAQAVQLMDKGVEDVEIGSSVINQSGDVLNNISRTFQAINEQICDVSATAEEMAAGTEEVTASLEDVVKNYQKTIHYSQDISSAAKSQLATMVDISASVDALSKMAEDLTASLSQFKIR